MNTEIEKKFLLKKLPEDLKQYPNNKIYQGYIVITDDDIEVRVRKKGGKYFQTIKKGWGLERSETEIELGEKQFEMLWPLTDGKRVEKIRYEIDYGDKVIELDIYSGTLEGLITAEIEFQSVDESKDFIKPDWFGKEITDDERYKNKNLASLGIPRE